MYVHCVYEKSIIEDLQEVDKIDELTARISLCRAVSAMIPQTLGICYDPVRLNTLAINEAARDSFHPELGELVLYDATPLERILFVVISKNDFDPARVKEINQLIHAEFNDPQSPSNDFQDHIAAVVGTEPSTHDWAIALAGFGGMSLINTNYEVGGVAFFLKQFQHRLYAAVFHEKGNN